MSRASFGGKYFPIRPAPGPAPATFAARPYVPQRPEPAVILPLLCSAIGALVLAGFLFGVACVACLDGLACITVSN